MQTSRLESTPMTDDLKPDPETDSTHAEELARVADAKALAQSGSFVRWFLVRFSTRAHFMRFIATVILLFTVVTMLRGATLPEAWWGILGMTLGYYFRGATVSKDND